MNATTRFPRPHRRAVHAALAAPVQQLDEVVGDRELLPYNAFKVRVSRLVRNARKNRLPRKTSSSQAKAT